MLADVLIAFGYIIIVGSYIPQIIHLLKTKNSDGISFSFLKLLLTAVTLIFVGSILTGAYGFIVGNGLSIICIIIIYILAHRYRND